LTTLPLLPPSRDANWPLLFPSGLSS
jgi:hypothetical protein